MDEHGRVAGVHRRAEGTGEAAVAGRARQLDVAWRVVAVGPAVGRGEVPDSSAELILDLGLGVLYLPRGHRVVQIGEPAVRAGVRPEPHAGREQVPAVPPSEPGTLVYQVGRDEEGRGNVERAEQRVYHVDPGPS